MADTCRCHMKVQPFARAMIGLGVRLTCPVHTARWWWDGVAFVPDPTFLGLDAEWGWHSMNWARDDEKEQEG